MRIPRDYDAELKALDGKARQLRQKKLQQFGELVQATGADTLPVEQLAGALLAAATTKDAAITEGWRKSGAAFFQGSRDTGTNARGNPRRAAPDASNAPSGSADSSPA